MPNAAAQAYARVANSTSSPRDIEAQALLMAANKLQEIYQEFESKLVAALTTAHAVDAEVRKVLDNKPWDNPLSNNDGKRLLAVECAARHLGSINPDYSIMTMKIPTFGEPNKLSWPPPTPPILPQDVMPVLRGPSADWQRDLAERDRERRAESQRVAAYYSNQAQQKEEREAAEAKAERQRMRNGGSP